MTDLIERLRTESAVFDQRGRDIANESADEITRLRALLSDEQQMRWHEEKRHKQTLEELAKVQKVLESIADISNDPNVIRQATIQLEAMEESK